MDASAYLKRQGWRGDGHSLDHSNRGIKKPLLVGKKTDVLGVGLDKHKTVSDQWWLRAFDQGLKSLGTGEESVLAAVQKHGVHRGGLYGRFIKGERIAGSIGQTPQSSEEDTTSGTNTPADQVKEASPTMAVDIPPPDKLERVVGEQSDKNSHDAMMYLLQHPEAAPASMKKLLDRKRKRAETATEKRARRKVEHHEKRAERAKASRKQAIEEGTWDAEKEEDVRKQKEINRRADQFVLEAQRRGVIPLGPNEIRKGIVPIPPSEQPNDELQQLFDRLAMKAPFSNDDPMKPSSKKADRYLREKMKRQLKAAAKAYLMGEKLPHEQTREDKQAKKDEKKMLASQKRADTAQREAERMATREARAEYKRERRAKRKAQKAELNKIIEARDAALKAGKTSEEFYAELAERELAASDTDEDNDGGVILTPESSNESTDLPGHSTENQGDVFQTGLDEVKLGMNRKGNKKKIPGVGAVDRYPTKAEKKAKKLKALAVKNRISEEEMAARLDAEKQKKLDAEQLKIDTYRALKHGMTLEEYRAAFERGDVHHPFVEKRHIDPEKLAEYKKRAAEKGVKLEDYIRRRDEKSRQKKAEKLGNPFQQDLVDNDRDDAEYIDDLPEQPVLPPISDQPSTDADAPTFNGLGFVLDTEGDPALASVNFQSQARAAIRASKPLAIVDTAGDVTYSLAPNMPVPLDPRIWEGQKVKDLPKHIRKARRDWMALKREEKKARATDNGAQKKVSKKVSKAQRKIAARDAFVKQILFQSRTALRSTGETSGMVTIEGVENVPLVKVESRDGPFSRIEIDLARTAARRVLRNVKREKRAKDGKGKGWKKRERAEKEARRNAGISGAVNKARFDPAAKGANKDLLL